jgi:Pyridine nucleotide-disulphide oxidoreductase, dimerisation domain
MLAVERLVRLWTEPVPPTGDAIAAFGELYKDPAYACPGEDTETSGNLGGSIYDRNAPGTARFLVDRERRILVGCTITGSEVADFLHAVTTAVVGELPLERLRHAVPPFPTRSEIWLSLLEQAGV